MKKKNMTTTALDRKNNSEILVIPPKPEKFASRVEYINRGKGLRDRACSISNSSLEPNKRMSISLNSIFSSLWKKTSKAREEKIIALKNDAIELETAWPKAFLRWVISTFGNKTILWAILQNFYILWILSRSHGGFENWYDYKKFFAETLERVVNCFRAKPLIYAEDDCDAIRKVLLVHVCSVFIFGSKAIRIFNWLNAIGTILIILLDVEIEMHKLIAAAIEEAIRESRYAYAKDYQKK